MIPLTEQNPPRGLRRWLLRLPIWLYRAGLGWLFKERLLLLTHIGRRSGIPRRTVLEVVHHDTAADTYFIASGWGERSDWLLNIQQTSKVKVDVGRRFEAIARRVPILEAQRALLVYARRHPWFFQRLAKLMVGRRLRPTEKDCLTLARSVPVVVLVPIRKAASNFRKEANMKNRAMLVTTTLIGLILFSGLPESSRADDFYKGKTIRFIVGFAAGGGFDTYSRMIARHIGKHIPGHPDTIVENMTGAGSLVAANYVFNKADPDGLTIGNFIGPLVLQDALGNKAAKFDGRKFGWLGVPTPDSGVCALTKASGISSADEWIKAKEPVKLGGTAPGSTTDDVPKLIKAAIGLPIQMIEGYKGTSRIRVAAEAGEIDGGCWAWESIKPTWSKALEAGEVRPVLQTMLESHPELKHVPLAINYAKTDDARELLKIANGAYGVVARPYSVPPGMPKDRLMMLQKAFMETTKDPELLAEAKKAKLEFKPVDGPTIAKIFADFYNLKDATKSKLKAIVLPGKQPTAGKPPSSS